MNQRTALMAAAGLTACILVVVGGVAGRLTATTNTPPTQAAAAAPAPDVGAATVIPPLSEPTAAPPVTKYPITPDQAIVLAAAAAPGAQVMRAPELVDFQGTAAYEVPFAGGGLIYVDATSGQILSNNLTISANSGTTYGEDHENNEHGRDHEQHEEHDG